MNTTDSGPAGGAALGEVFAATGGALLATAILLYLGWAHRTGRTDVLRRLARFAARDMGFADWAALPLAARRRLAARRAARHVLGHLAAHRRWPRRGAARQPRALPDPLRAVGDLRRGLPRDRLVRGQAEPALGADRGRLARAARRDRDARRRRLRPERVSARRRLAPDLRPGRDPLGADPPDADRRRGADPDRERDADRRGARRATAAAEARERARFAARSRRAFAVGGLLIGLSTFQAELDFGVPQFQFALEPIMLAFAAGTALVAARIWIGPGAALGAALFFLAVRGLVAAIVGPVFGEATPHLPLYLAEALCVEGLGLVIGTRRAYAFGALAGALVGGVGFFAEYAWSHIWMPVPWPQSLIAEAIVPALVTGIAAGVLGAFLGAALAAGGRRTDGGSVAFAPATLATAVIVTTIALNAGDQTRRGWSAHLTLDQAAPEPQHSVVAAIVLGLLLLLGWLLTRIARQADDDRRRRDPSRSRAIRPAAPGPGMTPATTSRSAGAQGTIRWLSPNSCQRYPRALAAS